MCKKSYYTFTENIIFIGIISLGIVFSSVKAFRAPITTDEAFNYNVWISKGIEFILSDYSAANNHILHSLLTFFSYSLFGNGEFSLRLISILSWAVFLCAHSVLIKKMIHRRTIRIACMATIAFNPYMIDFASLSRGYMLMSAMSVMAMLFLIRAMDSLAETASFSTASKKNTIVFIIFASIFFGLAMGAVPIAIRFFFASAISFALLTLNTGFLNTFRHLVYLSLPALTVVVFTYLNVFHQIHPKLFFFGAKSIVLSLASLHESLSYVAQAYVDNGGNPIVSNATLDQWHKAMLPQSFHLLFSSRLAFWLLTLLYITAPFAPIIALKKSPDKRQAIIGLTLLIITIDMIVEFWFSNVPLPLGRTWLYIIPWLILMIFIAFDCLAKNSNTEIRKIVIAIVLGFSILVNINALDSINLYTYRDWPDNTVVPSALETINEDMKDSRENVVLGYPWYQHACLTYYVNRMALKRVRLSPGRVSDDPGWNYTILNKYNMDKDRFAEHTLLKSFPELKVDIVKRP